MSNGIQSNQKTSRAVSDTGFLILLALGMGGLVVGAMVIGSLSPEVVTVESLAGFGLLGVFKLLLSAILFLFVLFALIVFRQVQLMNRVLAVPIAGGFKFVAAGLVLFAIGIFLLSLVIL